MSDLLRNSKGITMDKVTYMKDSNGTEHAVIDHGNEQFTSMPKSTYDELQAEATKVVDEAAPE
jgi:hypothetical protein